ncbi:MAG TPA: hypothetical protein VNZ85_01545 [Caulobacter sp.]|nr:hypothetical protein [Caulobacter sp.]
MSKRGGKRVAAALPLCAADLRHPYVTQRRLVALMHDQQYRVSIAWRNTAHNQPPHTSFYLGEGMKAPPRPAIRTP